MATKKKATKRKPREFSAWAVVDSSGKWVMGWHTHPALYRTKKAADKECFYGEGEPIVRVRITEVIK